MERYGTAGIDSSRIADIDSSGIADNDSYRIAGIGSYRIAGTDPFRTMRCFGAADNLINLFLRLNLHIHVCFSFCRLY